MKIHSQIIFVLSYSSSEDGIVVTTSEVFRTILPNVYDKINYHTLGNAKYLNYLICSKLFNVGMLACPRSILFPSLTMIFLMTFVKRELCSVEYLMHRMEPPHWLKKGEITFLLSGGNGR